MALVLDQPRQADVIALSVLPAARARAPGLPGPRAEPSRDPHADRARRRRSRANERGAPGEPAMTTTRLEAFSDGVIAILITIMILELQAARGRRDVEGITQPDADPQAPDLRAELRVPRHLLEQPSPHAPRDEACQRQDPLGEPASALLAVARAARHGLDRVEPQRPAADGHVWSRAPLRRAGVHDHAERDHQVRGAGFSARGGDRPRSQRPDFPRVLRARHRRGVHFAVDFGRACT